ncbi:UNVERIFIED_CONTAM: hypothetical protein GTU68_014225, partial [Idotea baltica]|nr:hypothetical protein [Idotea baltica]
IPEFLEKRFDRRSRSIFSFITIFISIVVDTAGGLYAGALVLQVFFPDLVLWHTTLALAMVAGVYTAFGGLKAVVYTDALQAIILLVGCSMLTYLLFEKLDFSWANVLAAAPEGHFSVVQPLDTKGLPWPGLILGVPFLGFWYWATNQYIIQRVLGAKDIRHARWGVTLAGFLKIIPLFIMVIPGAMAISLYPDLPSSDMVFPTMLEILPEGVLGLVLAGLVSAILSSVDSTLNSASTLIVVDFVKPAKPDLNDNQLANYGRFATLILMIIAAMWAPFIGNFDGLWSYLQQMFSIFVPPIVVLFLVGVFYKKGNGHGAFWTLIVGNVIGILLFTLGKLGYWSMHFTYNVGISVVLSSIVFIVFSNYGPRPSDEVIEKFTFNKSLIQEGNENMPWYKDYRIQSVVLLIIIIYTLIEFW